MFGLPVRAFGGKQIQKEKAFQALTPDEIVTEQRQVGQRSEERKARMVFALLRGQCMHSDGQRPMAWG